MKVGINGMGRIGRLALRAAMGAAERQADDPRAGNRLQVVHLNELKGGAAATAHLLQPTANRPSASTIGSSASRPMPQRPRSPGATSAWTSCSSAPASS
jgi:Glyceraldehyde 3-phosphate dehydrogenase, NAD binding domain